MASKFSVEPTKLLDTLKATVFKGASNEQLLALVVVANQYGLNPFTREMYAFPAKGGGIVPVVGVDGWIGLMNRHPAFDGIQFAFKGEKENLECEASVHIKGRSKPVVVTEYFSECYRNTEPWNQFPKRMLRHKALIQAARVAFGFTGIYDADEVDSGTVIDVSPAPSTPDPLQILPPPEPAKTEAKPEAPPAMEPWEKLGITLQDAGFTWDDFKAWAVKNKQVEGVAELQSFADLAKPDAERFLRAIKGLLTQLAVEKGGAK